MAGIFANIDSDISKIRQLKSEIEKVKKALTSINVKVDIDIAKGMEAQLKSLTAQYDALVQKVAQAEAKIAESTARINKSAETIIKAQEQMTKVASGKDAVNAQGASGGNTVAANAQTASVEAQARAYDELANEIDAVMGTRSQNIRRMLEEQNAIRIINEEIKKLTKYQSGNSALSASQQKRLEQLNASLLTHKTALSELRQSLNNSFKLDAAAATSMNALSQSLARMRMTYRELTEEERNSTFGKELLASIQQADAKIKQLDSTIGNHQRNVGNYASGWNGLGMSIQQIGRELPSLAMGWNTFFLAISNNLPILTDEIKRAKDEYNRLKEAGQQATPVWKQVVSSLLSWQTALTVGITLLTLYGKDIIEWVGNLFKAKDGTKELEEAMKRLNTAISSVYGNASEEMRVLKDLNKSLENAKRGTEEWNQIRNKLVTGYSKYLPSIDQEIDKTGTLANSYDRLAESIQKAAAARGFEELKSNEDKKYADSLIKTYQDVSKRLVSLYGEEQGRAYFEGWKRWLERLNNGEELSAKVQGAYGNVSMSSWNPFNDDTLNSLMQDLNKQYKAREKALDEYRKIFGITEGAEDNIASDSIKALRDRIAANREALEKLDVSSKEYKDLLASIHKDEQRLSLLTSSQNAVQSEIKSSKSYLDELAKLREDNENREIDLMKEGTEKQLAEINLRYDREIEAVKKLRAELEQAQGGKLTTEQVSTFDAAFEGIEAGRKRDTNNVWNEKINRQERAWNRYLQEYNTFQQKRQAITEEYNRKIAGAQTAGEAAILQKQMEEALSDLNMDKLKQEINWELVFSDLGNASKESLEKVKKQLKDFKDSNEYKEMSVEQIQVVDEALNKIQGAIIDKGGLLGDLPNQLEELRKAQEELNKAQEEYNQALKGGTEKQKESAQKKLNEAQKKLANQQGNVNKATDKAIGNFQLLSGTLTELGETSEMSLSQLGNLVQGIAGAFGESGSKIGGIIGSVFSLLDSIGSQGLDGFVGNIFKSVGNAAYGAWDTIFGWTGIDFGGDSDPHLEEDLQRLAQSNQDLEAALDNLSEKMDSSSVAEAMGIYSQQVDNINKQMRNTQEAMLRSQAAHSDGFFGIGGSHSSGDKINKGMTAAEWKEVSKVVGKTVNDSGDFFNLTSEEMWRVANEATSVYSKIKDLADNGYRDAAQYMDEYISYWKELEELQDQYREKLTSTSFDAIKNDFRSALLDMEDSTEDFAKNFEKMMQQAMLESFMTEKYDEQLKSWYKYFSQAMEDGALSKIESIFLESWWGRITNDATKEWEALRESMGWDSGTSSQQSATAGGFETMTQDQASELNGRFTALYESSLRQEAIQQGISNIAEDARNIIAQSYLELQQISENTGAIIKPIRQIQEDIAEVRRNTAKI